MEKKMYEDTEMQIRGWYVYKDLVWKRESVCIFRLCACPVSCALLLYRIEEQVHDRLSQISTFLTHACVFFLFFLLHRRKIACCLEQQKVWKRRWRSNCLGRVSESQPETTTTTTVELCQRGRVFIVSSFNNTRTSLMLWYSFFVFLFCFLQL